MDTDGLQILCKHLKDGVGLIGVCKDPFGGMMMRIRVGDEVVHPSEEKSGIVMDIRQNPACLMRHLVIAWEDGTEEELEELEFGPLED